MVKYGKHIEASTAQFASVAEFQKPVDYKAFKKLLACAQESAGASMETAQVAAQKQLQGSLWLWPRDADCVVLQDGSSGAGWFARLFEHKVREEATRIQTSLLAVQQRISSLRASAAELRNGSDASSEETVKKLILAQTEFHQLEQMHHAYADLNYVGFYKILKKFQKADVFNNSQFVHRLMPMIDDLIGSAHRTAEMPISPGATGNKRLTRQMTKQKTMETIDGFADQMMLSVDDADDKEKAQQMQRMLSMHRKQCAELLGEGDSVHSHESLVAKESLLSRLSPPFVQVLQSGYGLQALKSDFVAALVISIAGIPKAMSYASLTGLPVSAGIATLYVPCLVYALFGYSRQAAISPQSVTCLLLAQMVEDAMVTGPYKGDVDERFKITMLFTMFTGLMIALFGILNLTFLLNFISRPVLSGFVSASAIIAAGSTFKSLFGIAVEKSPILYILGMRILNALPGFHTPTTLISLGGIALMFLIPKGQKALARKLPQSHNNRIINKGFNFLRITTKIPAVLMIVALGILVGGNLCNFVIFTEWKPEHIVVGRGATSSALLQSVSGQKYNCSNHKDRIVTTYTGSGSGDGLASVLSASPVADFACSDTPPTQQELDSHSVQAFPLNENILCPVANMPLLHDTHQISLVLDVDTVAQIFSGEIRFWADSRIKALNPNLPWKLVDTSQEIKVVVRQGASGTTKSFSESLTDCQNCKVNITAGLDVNWGAPVMASAHSNQGVVDKVAGSEWSIGYATLGAVKHLQQDSGHTLARCVAIRDQKAILTADGAWSRNGSWPFIQTSYVMVPNTDNVNTATSIPRKDKCEARAALHRYLTALYGEHEAASKLYTKLSPLPAGLNTIPCAHRRLAKKKAFKCKKGVAMCHKVKMVGYIETSLPTLVMPAPGTSIPMSTIIVNALLLAAVALLEHVANVKLYADKNDYSISLSADLVAVGMANVFGALSGSFISAGGFSRSALNSQAKSQGSGLMSVFLSFLMVLAASPLLSLLPHAALNVILFMAVIHLVDYKIVVELVKLRRRGMQDLLALFIAFAATCFLGVVQGMMIAIAFSVVMFIFNSTYPEITELRRVPGSRDYKAKIEDRDEGVCGFGSAPKSSSTSNGVKVFRFEAALWFANVPKLVDTILPEFRNKKLHGIVLDMSSVPRVDTTAAAALKKLLSRAKESNVTVFFGASPAETKSMILAACSVQEKLFFSSVFEAELALEEVKLSQLEDGDAKANESEVEDSEHSDLEHGDEAAEAEIAEIENVEESKNHQDRHGEGDATPSSAVTPLQKQDTSCGI